MLVSMGEQEDDAGTRASNVERRPYRSQHEVRAIMLREGISMLLSLPRPFGLDNIRIEEVIERSGVPRGSAYRAWQADGGGQQQKFRDALASEVFVGSSAERSLHQTYEAAAPFLEQLVSPEGVALTPSERGELLAEAMRVVAGTNYEAVRADPLLRVQHGLTALAQMQDRDQMPGPLRRSIEDAGQQKIDRFHELYTLMMGAFGLRLKAGRTMEQFAYASAALSEGLMHRPMTAEQFHHTDEQGRPWTLFAVCLLGLVRDFAENDPDTSPDTEL